MEKSKKSQRREVSAVVRDCPADKRMSAVVRECPADKRMSAGQSRVRTLPTTQPPNHPSNHPTTQPTSESESKDTHTRFDLGVPSMELVRKTAKELMDIPIYYAEWWYLEMTSRGWLKTDGTAVCNDNWRPTLKAWYNKETPTHLLQIRQSKPKSIEVSYSPKDWILCKERCKNFKDGLCSKNIKIPPEKTDPPHIPEECKMFNS